MRIMLHNILSMLLCRLVQTWELRQIRESLKKWIRTNESVMTKIGYQEAINQMHSEFQKSMFTCTSAGSVKSSSKAEPQTWWGFALYTFLGSLSPVYGTHKHFRHSF